MANQRVGGGGRGTGKGGGPGSGGAGRPGGRSSGKSSSGPRQPGTMKSGGPRTGFGGGSRTGGHSSSGGKTGFGGGSRSGGSSSAGSGGPRRSSSSQGSSDWKPRAPRPDSPHQARDGRGRDNRPSPQGTGWNSDKSGWDTRPDRANKYARTESGDRPGAGYKGGARPESGFNRNERPKPGFDRNARPDSGFNRNDRPKSGFDRNARPDSGFNRNERPSSGFDRNADKSGWKSRQEGSDRNTRPSGPRPPHFKGARPEQSGYGRPPRGREEERPRRSYERPVEEPVGARVQAAYDNAEIPTGEDIVAGLKPVLELLASGDRPISSLLVDKDKGGKVFEQIIADARRAGIKVMVVPKGALDRVAGPVHHQGAVAVVSPKKYEDADELADRALAKGTPPVIVILDGVEDPHNLGAVIRAAESAGADGVIIPDRNAANLTAAVARASAGALEHMPVARIPNLSNFIEKIKEKGFWVVGLAGEAKSNYTSFDMTGPIAIVLGSEGTGIRPLVRQNCDELVSLPMMGKVSSLNVSVASGIILYEVLRQRAAKGRKGRE
jgi:23S rRNA (guanosine2251-2'-O)-methyltransferase